MDKILYGAAYYDEYMPEERLEKDMQMMQKAGINTIRIAESTWASEEPEDGVFDFTHVRRSIEAAKRYGISVIVGTPTYAIPPWLAAKHPEIIAITENGPGKYGARQNMDITNPDYRFYAERIIRKLMECVQEYNNVIGFQLDNETKHYHAAGPGVQQRFSDYLQQKFGTVEELNREFGFNYWSNRVDSWEHLPDVTGTINGSFMAEFEKFRRELVTEFLMWQRLIVEDYRRPDQFVTQNFDFEWRNYSFGLQPEVDQFAAAKALTIAGCDIYHPTQDALTGKEAAFCGAITRSLKRDNYLILETEAQGQLGWTPYDGQLRLQAFTHLANGADSVMYWHWHSIHNSFETYWRGLLSHDMEENRPYREAMTIGADLQRIGDHLIHLKKQNRAAILVSNESLTALSGLPMFPLPDGETFYNDIVREYADALYELNIEYDVVGPETRDFSGYDLLVIPALYSAKDELLEAVKGYVKNGGTALMTYKSAYANEYLTVSHDRKPHLLDDCFGVSYQEYTIPVDVKITNPGNPDSDAQGMLFEDSDGQTVGKDESVSVFSAIKESVRNIGFKESAEKNSSEKISDEDEDRISTWMELLQPAEDTKVLAHYVHPFWKDYAAVTEHEFGKGCGIYVGCHVTPDYAKKLVNHAAERAGIAEEAQKTEFPIVIKNGINQYGRKIHYYFNYSGNAVQQSYLHADAKELLGENVVPKGTILTLPAWGVLIFEENGR